MRLRATLTMAVVAATVLAARQEPPTADHHLRPRFHFTPSKNFMNDPNGLVFLDGEYHLFYQHNPEGERWGHMSWGHAVSRDLLRWEHLPLAMREEHGIMIFSGSAVVDHANTSGLCATSGPACLIAIYTGHTEKRQTQNLAFSHDRGRTWTKYSGNPVIDLGRGDNRDPKVFWHEPTKRWVMVTVLAGAHKVRLFSSPDLKQWTTLSDFGPAGNTGGAWECPDLFPLPVDGNADDVRWVLDVDTNPGGRVGGSGAQYFVGTFDGTRFVNDNPDSVTLWTDYGKDFYASLSYSGIPASDGRRIWIGWLSNWAYANDEPTSPWRGVQSLPRELSLRRTPDGIRLVQAPVRELASLRATGDARLLGAAGPLPGGAEIEIDVTPGTWTEQGVRLSNAEGEEVVVGVTAKPLEVFVDRRRSRLTPFHKEYPGRHAGPARFIDGRLTLQVVFDRTTLEVFVNGGEIVISDRVYPTKALDRIEALGGASVKLRELRTSPQSAASVRSALAPRWWESAAAIVRVGNKQKGQRRFPLDDASLTRSLDELKAAGVGAVEVFAPALGGNSFDGLDTIDRYKVDPTLGSMEGFKRLVALAHERDIAVVSFDNLGYSSVEAVDFLKAADDVKAGRSTRESSFFLWSDRADLPPPGHQAGNTFFFVRPTHLPGSKPGTFYESSKHEFWVKSERAGKYYWSKWAGVDLAGRNVRLPQYDWGSPVFQEEAEKVVRFWMDTGIDGMVIDAVNWYVDHTWAIGRRRMTDIIASYDNSYAQPEGAGAFREDPVAWITEGGWNSVQDYGLGIWWERGSDVITNAIESGDPRPIERALADYHDRVVAAGGTLYHHAPKFDDLVKREMAIAVVALVGDLVGVSYPDDFPLPGNTAWLLREKRRQPALQQLSTRRSLPTASPDRHYAFLRTTLDGSQRMLVVLNFRPSAERVRVDASGLACTELTDLRSAASTPCGQSFEFALPPLGYSLHVVR